jgi:hypothetical protein
MEMACIYFSIRQKWSKLDTLLQTEANKTEIKEKFKISDKCAQF